MAGAAREEVPRACPARIFSPRHLGGNSNTARNRQVHAAALSGRTRVSKPAGMRPSWSRLQSTIVSGCSQAHGGLLRPHTLHKAYYAADRGRLAYGEVAWLAGHPGVVGHTSTILEDLHYIGGPVPGAPDWNGLFPLSSSAAGHPSRGPGTNPDPLARNLNRERPG